MTIVHRIFALVRQHHTLLIGVGVSLLIYWYTRGPRVRLSAPEFRGIRKDAAGRDVYVYDVSGEY